MLVSLCVTFYPGLVSGSGSGAQTAVRRKGGLGRPSLLPTKSLQHQCRWVCRSQSMEPRESVGSGSSKLFQAPERVVCLSAALPNVSPLRPPSRGSRPLVALPASAGAALRPGAAHEHEPAAAHEAGPVWRAHSVPCVPSGEPPQPAAQLPWSGPEQLGQAVLLLEVTPAPACHLHSSYSARLTIAPAVSAA